MKNAGHHISEADLHAYIDGQLDAAKCAAVEAYLRENPDETRRIENYRRVNAALHSAYDPILNQPVPDRLKQLPSARRPLIGRIAASAAWLGLGLMLGLSYSMQRPLPAGSSTSGLSERLVGPATAAHAVYVPEVRHPVEVGADQEAHLSKWLSKRLGAELKPPHLSEVGFELVGGRLLPSEDGPAAQFMYQDQSGARLTLYVRQSDQDSGETAFRYLEKDGLKVFYWVDGKLGYALSGPISREALLRAAEISYQGLSL